MADEKLLLQAEKFFERLEITDKLEDFFQAGEIQELIDQIFESIIVNVDIMISKSPNVLKTKAHELKSIITIRKEMVIQELNLSFKIYYYQILKKIQKEFSDSVMYEFVKEFNWQPMENDLKLLGINLIYSACYTYADKLYEDFVLDCISKSMIEQIKQMCGAEYVIPSNALPEKIVLLFEFEEN